MNTEPVPRRAASTILDAYRRDVAGRGGRPFGREDGAWIQLASLLSHVGMAEENDREPMASAQRLARSLLTDEQWSEGYRLDPLQPRSELSLEGRIRAISEMAEDAGALLLAEALLIAFVDSSADVSELERGRIEAVRARLAWKSGRHDVAKERYDRTLRTARRIRSSELRVRGLIGRAILARLAGNYPLSRDIAHQALRLATRGGMRRLAATCHHMLMVCAALSERFQEAIVHGWAAFVHASDDSILEAEVLGNLGQLFLDIGDAETGAAAFKAVLGRHPSNRIRVPALGGLALASARVGDKAGAFSATEQLVRDADDARPYDFALALVELGEAHALLGESDHADAYRARALTIARAHSYHEIPFRIERSIAATPPVPSRGVEEIEAVAEAVRHLVPA